jgi:hypothetical protein
VPGAPLGASTGSSNGLSLDAIAGISAAGGVLCFILLAAIIALAVMGTRRRRRRRRRDEIDAATTFKAPAALNAHEAAESVPLPPQRSRAAPRRRPGYDDDDDLGDDGAYVYQSPLRVAAVTRGRSPRDVDREWRGVNEQSPGRVRERSEGEASAAWIGKSSARRGDDDKWSARSY